MVKNLLMITLLAVGAFMLAQTIFGQKIVTAAQVNGTWRETSSNPKGITTDFKIWAQGKGELAVEFFANNAAKKFSNSAKDTAMIEGAKAMFKPVGNQMNENNPCVMTLTFSAAKLIVEESGECGWGAGVSAAGTYKRISTKKPVFDE